MEERIIRAANEQVRQFGFRRFTMDDVAAELGMSKKTLYKFFISKQELINAVLKNELELEKEVILKTIANEGNWFDALSAMMDKPFLQRIPNHLLEEINRHFPEHKKQIENIRDFTREQYKILLQQGIESGHIQPGIDLDILVRILDEMILTIAQLADTDNEEQSFSRMLEELQKTVFFGILKREW